ncbi:hypothetical protein BDQ12DRAFT_737007 [Crucibulum laeve]|uniref:DUF6533 domain-containing protein n=1 Tax=Crucibulum laeve TaxID=68775 RepID=A0A5C3M5M3_9AGAR|nr:hypothetical protein BDQ12DRAFT_737007 [Crucibulum laeve]
MDLETLVEQGTAINLVAASCMTCILYDHFITLDQEIARMWPARMSVAKILFLLNRYLVQAMLIFNCISASQPYLSPGVCVFYLRWLVVTLTVTGAIVQGILVLRVWALHRNNKLAKGITYFFYASGTATLVGLVITDYINEDVLINKALNSLPGCYATSVPSIIAGFWIVPLVVESVLFMLVISRAFVWWKNGSSAPRILSLLARDSTVYFTVFVLLRPCRTDRPHTLLYFLAFLHFWLQTSLYFNLVHRSCLAFLSSHQQQLGVSWDRICYSI